MIDFSYITLFGSNFSENKAESQNKTIFNATPEYPFSTYIMFVLALMFWLPIRYEKMFWLFDYN